MSGKRSRTSGDTKLQLDQKDVLLLGLHQKGQCSSHVGVTRILLRASPEGIDHTTSASIQLPEIRFQPPPQQSWLYLQLRKSSYPMTVDVATYG
ncbi:hypothetical protein GQR58_005587 [Nymphon striatum]|nr:hypothetical protein GQR58_005587 [Nymphon striatum]